MLPGVRALLLSAFSIGAVMRLNSAVVQTTAEFDRYRAVLENTFQSSEMGQASFQFLTDFASKTPFQLNELTGSFVKLVNRGLTPTEEQMRSMGDMAASQGKSFDQYVEAILDSTTGEHERLKEFGVVARTSGNQVTMSFKNQTTTIANTSEAIQDYLIGLGEMDGVKGSMKSISITLGGMLSNLRDKFSVFAYKAGQQLMPLYEWFMDKLGKAIEYVSTIDLSGMVGKVLGFLQSLEERIRSLAGPFQFVKDRVMDVINGFQLLFGIPIEEFLIGATVAMWGLNKAMAMNPYLAIAIGVLMLVGLIQRAWTKVEWFRGSIMALGAGFKHVAETIKDHVITRFKEILGGLGKLGEAVLQLVQGKFGQAVGAAKDGMHMLTGTESIDKLKKNLGETGRVAAGAYIDGAREAMANKANDKGMFGTLIPGESLNYEQLRQQWLDKQDKPGDRDNSSNSTTAISGVTGGGHKQTHITINVGKLNEQININTTNLREGGEKVAAQMEELLLRILNSANQMQTT